MAKVGKLIAARSTPEGPDFNTSKRSILCRDSSTGENSQRPAGLAIERRFLGFRAEVSSFGRVPDPLLPSRTLSDVPHISTNLTRSRRSCTSLCDPVQIESSEHGG